MKLTTVILAIATMTGGAWAQNPGDIDTVRSIAKSLEQKQAADSNAALAAAGTADPQKAAPATPVVKPVTAPAIGASPKPIVLAPAKPKVAPVAAVKTALAAKKPATGKPQQPTHKPVTAKSAVTAATPKAVAAKPAATPKTVAAKAPAAKKPAKTVIQPKVQAKAAKPTGAKPAPTTPKPAEASAPKPEDKKWAMNGKRDPFFSPVVQQQGGSGCSTGKKCLEIGQINVRGVVKSDSGFIAVVTNNLNKAYFLRENDPVFNGYVVRITGDSVVFQETVQDKLGKSFTREVVKRITTPAV